MKLNQTGSIIAFLMIWGLLFLVIHLVHLYYFEISVVFYAALFDLFLSGTIVIACKLSYLNRILTFTPHTLSLTVLFGLSCGYIFSITVPTVIDRSLSAYILEKLVQRGGGIKEESFLDMFVEEFIPESQLMKIRVEEALSSGTVSVENGCVLITPKGRRVAAFTSFYRKNMLPKKRVLRGEVTDDLTNIFKDSPASVRYTCSNTEN